MKRTMGMTADVEGPVCRWLRSREHRSEKMSQQASHPAFSRLRRRSPWPQLRIYLITDKEALLELWPGGVVEFQERFFSHTRRASLAGIPVLKTSKIRLASKINSK